MPVTWSVPAWSTDKDEKIGRVDDPIVTPTDRVLFCRYPLRDRVLLKRTAVEEKTPAGIIIPDTAKEKPVEGEVLAIGPGAPDEAGKLRPLEVMVGGRVLFGK